MTGNVWAVFEKATKEPWSVRQGGDHGRDPNAYDLVQGVQNVARGYWGGQADMEAAALAVNTFARAREALRGTARNVADDGLCWCEHLSNPMVHGTKCRLARAALAAMEGRADA